MGLWSWGSENVDPLSSHRVTLAYNGRVTLDYDALRNIGQMIVFFAWDVTSLCTLPIPCLFVSSSPLPPCVLAKRTISIWLHLINIAVLSLQSLSLLVALCINKPMCQAWNIEVKKLLQLNCFGFKVLLKIITVELQLFSGIRSKSGRTAIFSVWEFQS